MISTGTGIQTFESPRTSTYMRDQFAETIAGMRDMTYTLRNGIRIKAYELSMWT
jgi:hypothetical protein